MVEGRGVLVVMLGLGALFGCARLPTAALLVGFVCQESQSAASGGLFFGQVRNLQLEAIDGCCHGVTPRPSRGTCNNKERP